MGNVSLKNVFKTYPGNVEVVKDLSLEIQDKEFLVLVGPSGCGKSTTLRMIAGLEDISRGTISIDGKVVNEVPPKDRDIAMVFQNYALYPHMSVYKNMAYGLKMRKYPKDEIDARVREAAEILGITLYLDRKPKALSGGQRQRVAVGRAIVRKPRVFLFDEPLSNLDAKMRVQMRAEISKLHHRLQTTIVYVTHDQVEAMTMGTRIVVMKDGIIQQVAAPLDLFHHPANKFVAGFIGSPPMNFFEGEIKKDANKLYFSAGAFSLALTDKQAKALKEYAGRKVCFGVRPGDLSYVRGAGLPAGEEVIEAGVEVVEPMGDEIYVYLEAGKHSFVAKITEEADVRVGREMSVAVNMAKTRFFDIETEQTIV
jgi:multiple sugar transport system ATP-binding protein